ncbi:hypothetical protein DPMN_185452 [Dreissena polymorpha]|uniref:Uncharacterized protein n=1 Tax=Dreissena polymorpha TaxID=45954 RepID=A0A9D4DKE7_DREPO|nr:hypothetical protein DPMN_185452 [Dreissena polymorpha]
MRSDEALRDPFPTGSHLLVATTVIHCFVWVAKRLSRPDLEYYVIQRTADVYSDRYGRIMATRKEGKKALLHPIMAE